MKKPTPIKRLYLSGPITGIPGGNAELFKAEAARLRSIGYRVINPVDLASDGLSWVECMRADIAALVDCDAIAMLPGWERSRGATLEWLLASELGLPVFVAADIGAEPLTIEQGPGRPIAVKLCHWARTGNELAAMLKGDVWEREAYILHDIARKHLMNAVAEGGAQ